MQEEDVDEKEPTESSLLKDGTAYGGKTKKIKRKSKKTLKRATKKSKKSRQRKITYRRKKNKRA